MELKQARERKKHMANGFKRALLLLTASKTEPKAIILLFLFVSQIIRCACIRYSISVFEKLFRKMTQNVISRSLIRFESQSQSWSKPFLPHIIRYKYVLRTTAGTVLCSAVLNKIFCNLNEYFLHLNMFRHLWTSVRSV